MRYRVSMKTVRGWHTGSLIVALFAAVGCGGIPAHATCTQFATHVHNHGAYGIAAVNACVGWACDEGYVRYNDSCIWRRVGSHNVPVPEATYATAPTGLAGFRLGASASQVEQTCVAAGYEYTDSEERGSCSAPPKQVGLLGPVEVRFCGGKACMYRIRDNRGNGGTERVLNRISRAWTVVNRRHGHHEVAAVDVPPRCLHEWKSTDCLQSGLATADYVWRFPRGQRIRLRTRLVAHVPAIELRVDANAQR